MTRRSGEDAPFFDDVAEMIGDLVERIRLGPISFGALHHLLTTRTGHRFARPVLARIERASGGNPMTGWFLTMVPQVYVSKAEALQWCTDHGLGSNVCLAREFKPPNP